MFETLHDYVFLSEVYIVARIDGRGFTRLTKELHSFEAPFDVRCRDMMVATVEHLMHVPPRRERLRPQGSQARLHPRRRSEREALAALGRRRRYWAMRKEGRSVKESSDALLQVSVSDKNELLFKHGINFNDLPSWQKRGVGIYWETYEKLGTNPKTGEAVTASRRRLTKSFDLPMKDRYSTFIETMVQAATPEV